MVAEIKTERLILRPWREEDLEPFAMLNADPHVMEFFTSTRNYQETSEELGRIKNAFETCGWGFWAATLIDTGEFIGFIGIKNVTFPVHFAPAVEIGWRLAHKHWGHGYATEGANAALKYGFQTLGLKEIVSFTTVANIRSRNVMEKIGMHTKTEDDFDHPLVPKGHKFATHVLYRITREEWDRRNPL